MFFLLAPIIVIFLFPILLPFLVLFIEIKDILITAAIISGLLLLLNISMVRDGLISKKKWFNALLIIIPLVFLLGFAYLAATVEEQQIIDLIRKIPYVQKLMEAK